MKKSTDFEIFGTITKRTATLDPDGTSDPLTTLYDAVPTGREQPRVAIKLADHLPNRRISKGARIIPAEVGDPCVITYREGKLFLWPFTEGVPFIEACPSGGTPGVSA